jgi:hypothetical protein
MRVAEQRFRPQFLVAFDAWLTTHPFTNADAPKGPTYMPSMPSQNWPSPTCSMLAPISTTPLAR